MDYRRNYSAAESNMRNKKKEKEEVKYLSIFLLEIDTVWILILLAMDYSQKS